MLYFFFFFFFQAEDGIRDLYVTGVQTCALPISGPSRRAESPFVLFVGEIGPRKNLMRLIAAFGRIAKAVPHEMVLVGPRSEEHTSELQSRRDLVCRLLLEKKKKNKIKTNTQKM